ncbi:hypothetical protein YC2023_045115 [Brassica napus]
MDPRSNQPVTDWQSISNRSPVSPLLDHGAEFRRSVCMALNVRNKLGAWFNSFKQDDTPRVYEIEQRLSVIQQGYKDVSAYYTELITLWKEYKNYIELPVCTCGQCECNDSLLWEKLQQCSRVTKFLMGLNEVYEQTKSHILMLKPIPSIEKVYNMVAHDERQRLVRHVINSDSVVFQAPDSSQLLQFMESLEYAAAYNVYKPKSNRHDIRRLGRIIFRTNSLIDHLLVNILDNKKPLLMRFQQLPGGCLSLFFGGSYNFGFPGASVDLRTVAVSLPAASYSCSVFRNGRFML